jgi:hypothetical protein
VKKYNKKCKEIIMENSIINSLKRLERVGGESSRVTQKLFESCIKIGDFICKQVPSNVELPRGYEKVIRHHEFGWEILKLNDVSEYERGGNINVTSQYINGDFNYWINGITRKLALIFAKDISEGLLDEISEFLEKRKKESEKAIEILENAKISA